MMVVLIERVIGKVVKLEPCTVDATVALRWLAEDKKTYVIDALMIDDQVVVKEGAVNVGIVTEILVEVTAVLVTIVAEEVVLIFVAVIDIGL